MVSIETLLPFKLFTTFYHVHLWISYSSGYTFCYHYGYCYYCATMYLILTIYVCLHYHINKIPLVQPNYPLLTDASIKVPFSLLSPL